MLQIFTKTLGSSANCDIINSKFTTNVLHSKYSSELFFTKILQYIVSSVILHNNGKICIHSLRKRITTNLLMFLIMFFAEKSGVITTHTC